MSSLGDNRKYANLDFKMVDKQVVCTWRWEHPRKNRKSWPGVKDNAPKLLLPPGGQNFQISIKLSECYYNFRLHSLYHHTCLHLNFQAEFIKYRHFKFCSNNILFDKNLVQIAG